MIDHDQLAARHTDVIRRHWRALADSGGVPPRELLDELAAVAEHHASQRTGDTLKALTGQQAAADEPSAAAAQPAPQRTGRTEPSGKPRTRRTTSR